MDPQTPDSDAASRERLQQALGAAYQVERRLGRGGMATVYLAHDRKHDRPVALKVLHPDLGAALGPHRFQREIRLVARLQHPHILPVHDSGAAADQLWFTMPFVEGESLRDRLGRERQLPLGDAIRIAIEVARALDYSHRHGIIHRDIKPENILLTKEGDALVADFGIARAVGDRVPATERLTATGLAIGTPAYMSPEQAAGERDVDARSDIYALGSVVYEMLAGEPPFTGSTPQAVIAKRFATAAPDVGVLRDGTPPAIRDAVARALARSPADRFQTAAEFARAFEAAAHGEPRSQARSDKSSSGAAAPASLVPDWARGRTTLLLSLGLAIALGVGVPMAWRRVHGVDGVTSADDAARVGAASDASAVPTRLAVLPFENVGDTSGADIADGIAGEIRGKLAGLPGLLVIASSSSNQYRRTVKRPAQIARELGVRYLLMGQVQLNRAGGSGGRVRVSPELVDAERGATTWGEPFDAALTDVFEVQADIASRVADALNVALGAGERAAITAKPTQSVAAYNAYLQAMAAEAPQDVPSIKRGIALYEKAVALDPTFVRAWAYLAGARASLYRRRPSPELAAAVQQAIAQAKALAPGQPEALYAESAYRVQVLQDYWGALALLETALRIAPNDWVLLSVTGQLEFHLGRPEGGISRLRQAQAINPRDQMAAWVLAHHLVEIRRYGEARKAADHVLALDPRSVAALRSKIMSYIGEGDVTAARAVLRSAPRAVDRDALIASLGTGGDLTWILDEGQQRRLLALRPELFEDDRGNWGLALAHTHALRGDSAQARAYADSARIAYLKQLETVPANPLVHVLYAVTLAYLGRNDEAMREGVRAVSLPAQDEEWYNRLQLVRIYILSGEHERAIRELEPLLKQPNPLSPGWLRVDPMFAPLRGNPRFDRLVAVR